MSIFKNYLFFFLYIFINPKLWKLATQSLYLPVYLQFEWLSSYDIKTVIDIGGHHGKVSKVLQYLFPKARFYIFEPILENVGIIKNKLNLSNTDVENIALSSTSGVSYFNKYANTEVSSLLAIHKNWKYLTGENAEKITVSTTTLDEYFKNTKLHRPVFLKIDTQGTEGIILKNGVKTLKYVDIIHIEMTFEEIYKNESLFDELYLFLTKQNFLYRGEISESYFYPRFKPRRQINAIFVKPHLKEIYD